MKSDNWQSLSNLADSAFIKQIPIIKADSSGAESTQDFVIKEERVSFYLNGKKIISTMCLPKDQDAHIVGFLFNEAVVESFSDVKSITIAKDGLSVFIEAKISSENLAHLYHEKTLTSGCCVGVSANFDGKIVERFVSSKAHFHISHLQNIIADFEKHSTLFELTGCVHKVIIYTQTKCFQSEDIGRHNALDKAIGKAIMANVPLDNAILIVSGRLSMEMVIKCAMSGIPLVISRSATTALGVKTALKLGITLIGFARDNRLNIYTHKGRILM